MCIQKYNIVYITICSLSKQQQLQLTMGIARRTRNILCYVSNIPVWLRVYTTNILGAEPFILWLPRLQVCIILSITYIIMA